MIDLKESLFDLSDPENPVVESEIAVGRYDPVRRAHDLYISDDILYVACEIGLLDTTHARGPNVVMYYLGEDPTDPDSVGAYIIPLQATWDSSRWPWVVEVFVQDEKLYMADAASGPIIAELDITRNGQDHVTSVEVDTANTWVIRYKMVRTYGGVTPNNLIKTHTIKVPDDHNYLFVCDETTNGSSTTWQKNVGSILRMFDISNIENYASINEDPSTYEVLEPLQIYEVLADEDAGRIHSDQERRSHSSCTMPRR